MVVGIWLYHTGDAGQGSPEARGLGATAAPPRADEVGGGDRARAQASHRGAAYRHIPSYTKTQEEEDATSNGVMAGGLCCSAAAG